MYMAMHQLTYSLYIFGLQIKQQVLPAHLCHISLLDPMPIIFSIMQLDMNYLPYILLLTQST